MTITTAPVNQVQEVLKVYQTYYASNDIDNLVKDALQNECSSLQNPNKNDLLDLLEKFKDPSQKGGFSAIINQRITNLEREIDKFNLQKIVLQNMCPPLQNLNNRDLSNLLEKVRDPARKEDFSEFISSCIIKQKEEIQPKNINLNDWMDIVISFYDKATIFLTPSYDRLQAAKSVVKEALSNFQMKTTCENFSLVTSTKLSDPEEFCKKFSIIDTEQKKLVTIWRKAISILNPNSRMF